MWPMACCASRYLTQASQLLQVAASWQAAEAALFLAHGRQPEQ